MIENQLISFVIYVAIGIILGVIFDFFRAFRKSIKHSNIATYIEDIIYVIIAFLIVVVALQIFSDGELRFYIFLGIIIGNVIYFALISKYLLKVETFILEWLIKIIKYPINLIEKFILFLGKKKDFEKKCRKYN